MADGYNFPIGAEDIEALTKDLISDIDKETAAIDARAATAEQVLAECTVRRAELKQKRDTILQAHQIQIAYLNKQRPPAAKPLPPPPPYPQHAPSFVAGQSGGPAQGVMNPLGRAGPSPPPFSFPPPPPWVENRSKTRARIGPQRYFILTDIHENGPTIIEKVSERTGLTLKRIKDQVRSDINDGMLDEVLVSTGQPAGGTPMLRLSTAGGDLLRRFIEYRKANNQALPTKEEALGQAEGDFA